MEIIFTWLAILEIITQLQLIDGLKITLLAFLRAHLITNNTTHMREEPGEGSRTSYE